MISRVAEACFWFHRHLERADSTARLLRVNRSFLLDVSLPEIERWWPVIVVSGEQRRFSELFPPEAANDAEGVQDYLVWDKRCEVGVRAAVYWARENARTIRDVIGRDAWEAMNAFWHWVHGGQGRRLYTQDRDGFYARVKQEVVLAEGTCEATIMHGEAFDFMRLGMLLERAAQTARIVDVKYHLLGPTEPQTGRAPVETAQWMALLRSCSAEEAFLKTSNGSPSGPEIAAFLVLEPGFPRAVRYSLERAWTFLQRIRERSRHGGGEESRRRLGELVAHVAKLRVTDLAGTGLHAEATHIIDTTAEVCASIHDEYFDPRFDAPAGRSYPPPVNP